MRLERLNKAVMEKGPLLAGLDPDMEKLRALSKEIGYKGTDCDFLRDYCFEYIKAVKDTVVATKINIAFFEACELMVMMKFLLVELDVILVFLMVLIYGLLLIICVRELLQMQFRF